jgi:hypothetical protein
MTPAERQIALALGRCSFLPGTWDKRFCRALASAAEHAPGVPLTERQGVHLLRLAHKYRRQLPTAVIEASLDASVEAADRRVARGEGALADFTPARKATKRIKAAKAWPGGLPLPLFGEA